MSKATEERPVSFIIPMLVVGATIIATIVLGAVLGLFVGRMVDNTKSLPFIVAGVGAAAGVALGVLFAQKLTGFAPTRAAQVSAMAGGLLGLLAWTFVASRQLPPVLTTLGVLLPGALAAAGAKLMRR